MLRELKSAILVYLMLTVLTGVAYPLFVTGVAQGLFKDKANGSILSVGGKAVGSELIGQTFDDPKYFWGRLSATAPAYNGAVSSGSNYGPLNAALHDAVKARVEALKAADPSNAKPIPVDLATASGSGLDPHISLAGAYYQVSRIAHTRNMPEDVVEKIVKYHAEDRFLGVLGEPVVNVLKMNLFLDRWQKDPQLSLEKPVLFQLPKFMKWGLFSESNDK